MGGNFLKLGRMMEVIFLIIGIGFCFGSIQLGLGNLYNPGPGFVPFLSGSLLAFLGLIPVISSISRQPRENAVISSKKILAKESRRRLVFTVLTLFGYIMLFEPLGFLISSFIFFFLLLKLTEPKSWLNPALFSGVTVILSYLLFAIWLNVQLPRVIFRF